MAKEEDNQDNKTEEPSQKKIEDAIKKGNVVKSKEVTSFLIFFLLTCVSFWILPISMKATSIRLRYLIENAGNISVNETILSNIFI